MKQSRLRNFSIIAHVDHGKTTMTDRMLALTGLTGKRENKERILDSNPIEQERGVTIKLAPVTMPFEIGEEEYKLNLIDTPGHVDFSYEVERSLAACEAAILLVDASQGVQAQTVAHMYRAVDLGLTVLPVVNKIDLESAEVDKVKNELYEVFGFREDEVSEVSAKTGYGVEDLLERVVNEAPIPKGDAGKPMRCLVFNSVYDSHLGVIAFIRVVDGEFSKSTQPYLLHARRKLEVKELGIFSPDRKPVERLETGSVGYLATGLKSIQDLSVGDTMVSFEEAEKTEALLGYKQPKPAVYADFYPTGSSDFKDLSLGVEKLQLSDAALHAKTVHSPVLGSGFRLGFLGVFHIEITKERLEREQGVETILTNPTVEYRLKTTDGEEIMVHNPSDMPDQTKIESMEEPRVDLTIITPESYMGKVMDLLTTRRADYINTNHVGGRVQLTYKAPLAELISGLFDQLKSVSSGFASMDYEITGYQKVDAVKLSILLNHEEAVPLARIVVREKAQKIGRRLVEEIKELLPKHAFAVPIQAIIGSEVLARETKPAFRKDVTAKLYGGDQSRKDKLLKKQKKGKKRMARFGKVQISDEVMTKLATI